VKPLVRRILGAVLLLPETMVLHAAEPDSLVQGCPAREPLLRKRDGTLRILDSHGLAKRTTACVAPKFPALLRQAQFEGSVLVGVLVDENGRVTCARVLSGHPLVTGSAIDAARQWTFRPAMEKGRAVSFYGVLSFRFSTSGVRNKAGACFDPHG
jgi:TonB family protein